MIERVKRTSLLVLALQIAAAPPAPRAAEPAGWPQFRGPGGAGVADASSLPRTWSTKDNVAWVVDVPGRGWSSPIVWRDRVYVTTAVNDGPFKAPSTGIFGNDYAAELAKQGLSDDEIVKRVVNRDIELTTDTGEVSYRVYALDAKTGRVVWQQEAHRGHPAGGRHRKNTYASETPVTDGERLYVSFGGNVGIFCYSLDGTLLWKKTWPPQPIYLDFGTASSPVVHNGRVYQLHDNDGESWLAALDARTGRDVWNVKRTEAAPMKSGWATPFIWRNSARTEVVTVGRALVISYDLEGRELWRLKGMTQATPTPVADGDVLYVVTGSVRSVRRPRALRGHLPAAQRTGPGPHLRPSGR
jgi:outer membrane protein assembly factor BamB